MDKKKNKPLKPISENKMMIAIGLAIVIFTFVLIMDVGYLARTINILLYFPFGFGAYVVFALLLARGVLYVFSSRKIKLKHKWFLLAGSIVALIGISSIISLATWGEDIYSIKSFSSEYVSLYKDYYAAVGIRVPFLFREVNVRVGGGYLGFFISALFNDCFSNVNASYALSALVILIGLIVISSPFFNDLRKKNKKNAKAKQEKFEKEVEELAQHVETPIVEEKHEDFYSVKDQSKDIIKNASKVETPIIKEDPLASFASVPTTKAVVPSPDLTSEEPTQHIQFNDSNYNRVGGLVPAHFVRESVSFESHSVSVNSQDPMQEEASIIIERKEENPSPTIAVPFQSKQENAAQVNNIPDKKPEQIHLDFDAPSEASKPSNDELLTVKPEFSDPVVKQKNVSVVSQQVAPEKIEQAVSSKPKRITHKFIEPDPELLNDYESSAAEEKNNQTAEQRMVVINNIFKTFNVHAECIGYVVGPSVTRYNIGYTETAQFKSVNNLTNDISIRLGGVDARFEAIVPGETYSGLEISNAVVTMVGFKEVLAKLPSRQKHPLAVAFGKNISGDVIWADLNKMPHMLIAGTTGSGKSIFIHSIIMTLIMRNNPDDLRLVLVDPKRVEMSKYKGMPHLLCPNITEPSEVTVCLNKLVDEMERRYTLLEENCVSDIGEYNELCQDKPELEKMPYYVAILDEYSDLVDRAKDLQRPVISLAQKARACGIHLIICTQRPSTNVITGLIKGNLPTHVALMTASSVDSMTIIGEGGAEKLLGKGDMLVQSSVVSKVGCVRLQGCFVANKEILKVVDFLKQTMTTDYHPDFLDLSDHSNDAPAAMPFETGHKAGGPHVDEAYDDVKAAIMCEDYASISKIQREFGFGFNRAGRIFNQLVNEGIVEKPSEKKGSSTGCRVLIHDEDYGREAEIGSDEVASTESLDEYLSNADKADGSY